MEQKKNTKSEIDQEERKRNIIYIPNKREKRERGKPPNKKMNKR